MIGAVRALTVPSRVSSLLKLVKTLDQRFYLSCSSVRFDHYKTLGVARDATEEEIEKAYFNIAPNHFHDPSSKEMKKVLEAFETLTDEYSRKLYDAKQSADSVEQSKSQISETAKTIQQEKQYKEMLDFGYWAGTVCLSIFLIITVPKAGYSRMEGDVFLANGSSTLILGPKYKVVVDTLSPWDRDMLVAALARHEVAPSEVTHLVCTHGHPDHVGNNNLFVGEGVVHIVGWSVHSMDQYTDHAFNKGEVFRIDEDELVVVPTPGHTLDSVSVKVNTAEGVVVVAGDLFEKEEDLAEESIWKEAGSENEEDQVKNRRKILELADYIVPGHGPMFRVAKNK